MLDEAPHDTRRPLFRIADALESRWARVALSALVLLSLIPTGELEASLRPLFLFVFGADLTVRFLVWRSDVHGTRAVTVAGVVLAACDVIALLTFLPLEHVIDNRDVLSVMSLLRLTRLLVLVRLGRGVVRDLFTIVTRREQMQTLAFVTGAVITFSLVSAVITAQLSLDLNGNGTAHDEPFRERFWWAFRQIESPDNIVPTLAGDPIVVALSLALTLLGVFLVAFIIGVGTNVVEQLVRAERRRDLSYRGHTIIIGAVHEGEDLVREFVRMYAKNRQVPSPERLFAWLKQLGPKASSLPRVALLSRAPEQPDYLVEPIMRWVAYRQGDESEPESLQRVAAVACKRAIILAQRGLGLETDAVTTSALAALRAENPDCHAYVEVDDSEAKSIVLQVGGKNTVALDVPRFLGMFLCQHVLIPGVDALYRDLLTSGGGEIYTHVYTKPEHDAALSRLPEYISFTALTTLAQAHGVQLLGVYLGRSPVRKNKLGVVSVDGLVRWLNPADRTTPDDAAALGAKCGAIPLHTLRGLIGVAESYLPLASLAEALCHGGAPEPDRDELTLERISHAHGSLSAPLPGPSRVVLIGASDSLPALLRELSLFTPGVEVLLFLSARGGEHVPLSRRLARLGVGIESDAPLPGTAGRTVPLLRDGKLTVFTHDAPDLARFVAHHLKSAPPTDAVVFLCEAEGQDRDARTAMRVLRFVKHLEDGTIPHSERMHIVAEFVSIDKGIHLQRHVDSRSCGFANNDDLRLTLIAKETIKSYFMVHASFVPGVSEIYDELLEERGQDFMCFGFSADAGSGAVRWSHIVEAVSRRGATALAAHTKTGAIVTAVDGDASFAPDELVGVFAVGNATAKM